MRNNGMYAYRPRECGFALLEMVVSIGLIAASLFALSGTAQLAYRATIEASNRVRAGFIFEEGFEAMRSIRDGGWLAIANLALNQTYYLAFSGGAWRATTTAQTIDSSPAGGFTRSLVVRQVLRDASFTIASAGTVDPNARKIEMTVLWSERGRTAEITSATYFANIFLE